MKHYLGVLLSYRPGKKYQGLKLILESKRLAREDSFFYNIISVFNALIDANESNLLEDALDGILLERKGHGEVSVFAHSKPVKSDKGGRRQHCSVQKFYISVAFKLLGKDNEANDLFADANSACSLCSKDNILILHTGELYDYKP